MFVVFVEGSINEFQCRQNSNYLYELRRKILWPRILNPKNFEIFQSTKIDSNENKAIHSIENMILKAKSRRYRGISKMKSREKTRIVRKKWSQPLDHKQVSKGDGTRLSKGKVSPADTRCTCSLIFRWRSSSISSLWNWWKVWSVWIPLLRLYHFILLNKISVSTTKCPEWQLKAFHKYPYLSICPLD